MKFRNLLLLLLSIVLVTSCADPVVIEQCVTDEPYGFWSGIWHGFIIWFSFIGSLFCDDITIYAVNNTGGWYDFGFMIGVTGLLGLLRSS